MGVTYIKRRAYTTGEAKTTEKIGVDLAFAKGIYERLSNITDNKSLQTALEPENQYERWLLDMNELAVAIESGDTSSIDSAIVEFDSYLGSLGGDNEYPFKDSTYTAPVFLNIDSQAKYRVLMDTADNTYLTDSNGSEVLVIKN